MLVEVLLAQPPHFLEPRIVGPPVGTLPGGLELRLEQRPQRSEAVVGVLEAGREAIPGVDALALLGDESGLLQHAEVARHARLRETEDARELRDVQPLARQQSQEAEPGVVSQQTVEGAAQLHIY